LLKKTQVKGHFLEAVLSAPGPWGLRIAGAERWLASSVELAGSSQARRRGLRGRDGLDADAALVIAPTQGVHTFGMRFCLDVVGVKRNGEVVSVRPHVTRRRVVFSLRAFAMIEVNSGVCARVGLQVGDRLVAQVRLDDDGRTVGDSYTGLI
jgi:uncharacterized protein